MSVTDCTFCGRIHPVGECRGRVFSPPYALQPIAAFAALEARVAALEKHTKLNWFVAKDGSIYETVAEVIRVNQALALKAAHNERLKAESKASREQSAHDDSIATSAPEPHDHGPDISALERWQASAERRLDALEKHGVLIEEHFEAHENRIMALEEPESKASREEPQGDGSAGGRASHPQHAATPAGAEGRARDAEPDWERLAQDVARGYSPSCGDQIRALGRGRDALRRELATEKAWHARMFESRVKEIERLHAQPDTERERLEREKK